MPPSTLQIGGRRTAVPGAYGLINPDGLQGGVAGIKSLVLIGEAIGGKPVTELTDGVPTIYSVSQQNQVRALLRGGLLRDGALAALAPGSGVVPQRVLLAKVNPATQSTASLINADGDAVDLTSKDYGAFTSQISVSIGAGTTQGYAITNQLNDTVESADNIGGNAAFSTRYATNGDFATVRVEVDGSGVAYTYTKSIPEDEVTAAHNPGDVAVVRSANAYDTVQQVTVFGLLAGVAVSETVTLNGMTDVLTTQTYTSITAVRLNGATRGIITVEDEQSIPNVAFTIPATITANHTPGAIEVVSSSALDLGQRIVVTGVSPAGISVSQTLVLNGTTVVPGAVSFAKVLTARLDAACAGNVTVRGISAGPTAFVISAGNLTAGVNLGAGVYIPNLAAFEGPITLALVGAGPSSVDVVIRGISSAGVLAAEVVTVSAAPAASTTSWASVNQIEIGLMDAAQTISISGTVRSFGPTTTIDVMASTIASLPGFDAEALVGDTGEFTLDRLDYADASIKSASDVEFYADLDAIVQWFQTTSTLVDADRATGATGAPSITPAPVPLIGGSEGVTTQANWQAAFDALVALRDVYIVPLTTNGAVHAAMKAHIDYMDSIGNDPRSGFVPLSLSLGKPAVFAAIKAINSRNIAAVAQGFVGFSPSTGARTTYGPEVFAAICGGLNAALGVGVPLTRKAVNVLSFVQNVGWSPSNDANEMILGGLLFGEVSQQVGPRIVRSVTTWSTTSNPVYTEVSANDSANESIRRTVRICDQLIGNRAFDGFGATLKTVVEAELSLQVSEGIIRAFRNVVITDLGDTFDVAYELAAIEPVNFIRITANLARIPAAA